MALTTDTMNAPSFGIMTAPSQVSYPDVLRVWQEADAIPRIGHAWLYDHLMPVFGDPDGSAPDRVLLCDIGGLP